MHEQWTHVRLLFTSKKKKKKKEENADVRKRAIQTVPYSHFFVCSPRPVTPWATSAKRRHRTTSTPSLIPMPFSFLIFSATFTILSNTFDLLRLPDPILEFDLLHLPDPILEFDSLYSLWFWLNLACGLRALRLWMLSLLLSGLICGLAESVVVELVGLIGCCWVGWFWLISMGN